MRKPNTLATAAAIAVILGSLTAATIFVAAMMFFWFWLPVVFLQYVLWFFLARLALNRSIIRPISAVFAIAAILVFTPLSVNLPRWLTAMQMVAAADDTPLPRQTEFVEVSANPVIHLEMGSTVTFFLRPNGDVLDLLRDYVFVLEDRGIKKLRGEIPTESGRNVLLNFSGPLGAQSHGHLEVKANWNVASEAYDLITVRRSQFSSLPKIMLMVILSFGLLAAWLVILRE